MDSKNGKGNQTVHETAQVAASLLAADNGTATFDYRIEVYMSGALTSNVRRLASMAARATDPRDVSCLCVSALLMGAAALESLLTDLSYVTNRTQYNDTRFRHAGLGDKYNQLTGRDLLVDHPPISQIWDSRNAVGHSEVTHFRSRTVGERLNPAGAEWVAQSIEDFARAVWGTGMPDWFRSDAGL